MPTPTAYFSDGLTTVTLTATDAFLIEYAPAAPELRESVTEAAGQDGRRVDSIDYSDVTETARIALGYGTVANARASLNALQRLFDLARKYAERRAAVGGYFYFKADTGDTLYRSQVTGGRVTLDEAAIDYQYANGLIEADVTFTRRFYWEMAAEAEVISTLTPGGAGTTGAKTINNHTDGGHGNWLEIPASAVDGDLPAPCRVELNHNGGAVYYVNFALSHEVIHSSPMTVNLEGEAGLSASSRVDGITPLSNAAYGRVTWSGTSATDINTWAISAAEMSAAAGRWLKPIMRLGNLCAYTDLYLSFSVRNGSQVLYTSERVLMTANQEWQSLPGFPLPPTLVGVSSLVPLSLVLIGQRATAGSHTLDIDFVQLLPTDGFRLYTAFTLGLPQNGTIKDDGMAGDFYTLSGGLNGMTHYGEGGLMLLPGARRQRLRVLWTRTGGAMNVDDSIAARVYYRARRLTL